MRTYDRSRENLPPSRVVQLEPSLPENMSPNENAPLGIHNSSSPLIEISDNSSTISSVDATRPTRNPSPQSRMNGHFPQTYPHGPPSPVYSDTSPRDSSPISPPRTQFEHYADRRTPQSEELTPQSAESHLSTSSFSTAPSPHNHHLDEERKRLTLTGILGTFKCEHTGCTAPAFQTQYLLK